MPFGFSQAEVIEATLEGKPFRVILSKAARRALAARSVLLVAEMELSFPASRG